MPTPSASEAPQREDVALLRLRAGSFHRMPSSKAGTMSNARLIAGFAASCAAILAAAASFDRDMPQDLRTLPPCLAIFALIFARACFIGVHRETLCYILMLGIMGWMVIALVWELTEGW